MMDGNIYLEWVDLVIALMPWGIWKKTDDDDDDSVGRRENTFGVTMSFSSVSDEDSDENTNNDAKEYTFASLNFH
jgi:hypothetical protein